MSASPEEKWRDAMTKIFSELNDDQYKKMMTILEKCNFSTPQKKTAKFKRELPQKMIEMYGLEESISIVKRAMKEIPRNDTTVQDLLRPFVDNLSQQEGSQTEETGPAGAAKPEQTGENDHETVNSSQLTEATKQREIPASRKTIQDLKTSGKLDQKYITGKVVEKSNLSTYQTRDKVTKFYFHLGVADETACIKVVGYGKERFESTEEGGFYNIRDVVMEDNVMKVTQKTRMSRAAPFDIPQNLEVEAAKLLSGPVSSTAEIQKCPDKSSVSVEGLVKEIGPPEAVHVKAKKMKKKRQDLELEDDTGSITVCMWGEGTKHLRGLSAGDKIKVTNLRTNRFRDNPVSLNSTDFTRVIKVQSAAVQSVTMTVIGVVKSGVLETQLEADVNNRVETFVVASSLLADVLGISPEDDFEKKLLENIPFSARAQVQGKKINELRAGQPSQP